jgi:hypothetical protein
MSQIEHHWVEAARIETELMRKLIMLGLDWRDESAMTLLAMECNTFGPEEAKAAHASQGPGRIWKAEIFASASLMLQIMGDAAPQERDVYGGEIWKAFGRHLYVLFLPGSHTVPLHPASAGTQAG